MHIVDSHTHLNLLEENNVCSVDEAVENALKADVKTLLNVCTNLENFHEAILPPAEKYEHVYASVGVHPCYPEARQPTVDELCDLAQHDKVIAIGECGLDYFRSEEGEDMTWQHTRFSTQIQAARELNMPLIIHTRSAKEDTMDKLEQLGAQDCGGIMHCFVEDWDTAQRALDIGFYISFSGIVSFNSAKDLQEVAKKVPLDRILIETDAPYLAPVPFRGKPNQPAYTRHVAEKIAALREISLAELAEATTANFNRLFKL